MTGVPYTFASSTTAIPLSQLDSNFNTQATIGTTTIGLGNTVTSIAGLTLTTSNVNYAAEGSVTAAATTDLSTSSATRQSVSGNTTITSFGSGANLYRVIRFTGTPLITYNATTLITPTGANIQAAPGDVATLSSDGSGNWRIISYQPYGGTLSSTTYQADTTSWTAQSSLSLTPGKWRLNAQFIYSGLNGTFCAAAISTTSGSAGTQTGNDRSYGAIASGSGYCALDYIVTPTSTTTYYMNCIDDGSSGYGGTNTLLRAVRIY